MIASALDQLQFLRPAWFYAFIPLLLFVVLMFRRRHSSQSWKAVCDAQLLPYILTQSGVKSSRFPLLLIFFTLSLAIIAAAGPVFEKLPQPVFREQSALVVLLDLSQSMDATDLKPTRLQRARLKLLDILAARKGGQTALVVYAADAFVVTPLTDDTHTIANLVPSLQTALMPSQGSHAWRAMEKSLELFKQAGITQGDVLLITDGINPRDLENIDLLRTQGHRLSILGVGTIDGSPIPMNGGFLQDADGAIVLPKLRPAELQRAALRGGGLYLNMQADDSDTGTLNRFFTANKFSAGLDKSKLGKTDLSADVWKEEGPWLLLLVIPLAALGFRKGWLLCLPIILMPVSEPSYALELDQLWRNPDQQAMRAFNNDDAASAAELFEQRDWKASAYYRAGEFEQALKNMDNPATSDDYYNRGNALAQLKRYPEAIKAYDEAISLDEHNEDAAYNRELVTKALQQQQNDPAQNKVDNNESSDEQNSDKQDSSQQNNPQQENESDATGDKQNENQQQDESQQQASQQDNPEPSAGETGDQSDTEEKELNKSEVEQAMKDAQDKEQQQENEQTQQAEQEPSEQAGEQDSLTLGDSKNMNEDEQATEQWLKRIPDDPGLLLRRKFHYQYKRLPEQTPSDEQW